MVLSHLFIEKIARTAFKGYSLHVTLREPNLRKVVDGYPLYPPGSGSIDSGCLNLKTGKQGRYREIINSRQQTKLQLDRKTSVRLFYVIRPKGDAVAVHK